MLQVTTDRFEISDQNINGYITTLNRRLKDEGLQDIHIHIGSRTLLESSILSSIAARKVLSYY